MLDSFFAPFITIFFAELLDKSQLAVLLLSSKTKKRLQLFFGVIAAFAFVDGSAILFGTLVNNTISENVVKLFAGLLFLLFGIMSLRSSVEKVKEPKQLTNVFLSGFTLVFLSEWGDKTQLASGVFASYYHPLLVFLGVLSALSILSILAISIGSILLSQIKKQTVSIISGFIFLLMGIYFLITSI